VGRRPEGWAAMGLVLLLAGEARGGGCEASAVVQLDVSGGGGGFAATIGIVKDSNMDRRRKGRGGILSTVVS
jgi:hypothetical protein